MKLLTIASCAGLLALASSCGDANGSSKLTVNIDGSSTVYPITEAVAEEYRNVSPEVRVTVGISGTGGGFKKFCLAETDINDASRPIKGKEQKVAQEHKIEFVELPVAFDGLSVVISHDNDFVDHMTTAELKKIWQPGSTVKTWADVRDGWPAEKIQLFGPGTDSGTFDYFTEAINGKAQSCRSDFTASEDDNVLVQGVAGDKYALGFFGFAYYVENKNRLKVVPIDSGNGPVAPSHDTINNGTYAPLSRPLFIYVRKSALDTPHIAKFVKFYIDNAAKLASEVGYVGLPAQAYELGKKRLAAGTVGTIFGKAGKPGASIVERLESGQ